MNGAGWSDSTEPDEELDRLARDTIGAAIEVHRGLGPGFLENVYEQALTIELAARGIPFERQVPLAIEYRGQIVGQQRLDLLVGNRLIVELKAVESITQIHVSQLISYLRAAQRGLGLIINFNVPVLRSGLRRVALTHITSPETPNL